MNTIRIAVRTLAVIAALAAGASWLVACGSGDSGDTKLSLAGVVRTPPLSVSDVELPEVSASEPVATAMKPAAGELFLIYFGYTFCPDICPTTMSDISVALNDLPADQAERVTVGMVSVDPDRDTPDVLTAYLGHFFDRSMSLRTEDPDALAAAAKAFGVRYEVADHEPGADEYEVSHTGVTYVVDDSGTVVVEWPFGFGSDDMVADLKAILERSSTT